MKVSAKAIYSPLLIMYAIGPLMHDVIPLHSEIGLERGLYFTLFYLVALIAILPILLFVRKLEPKTISLTLGITLRMAIGLCVFLVPYVLLWSDWSLFHISLLIALYVSFLSMVAFRTELSKQSSFLKNSATGSYYKIVDGKPYRLTEGEVDELRANSPARLEYVRELNLCSLDGNELHRNESNLINHSDTYGNPDPNYGLVVNPTSGMPMVGGISGLDVHGNSWGTNFNEPSNTYDPNRGY
ncbi:hypothetical protein NFL61_22950 (plasmid) [Enterobacter ludwigii]|uniref:hypothetical protein n=1 Tax=Enterobacter ludwigii TaxID=299767 RepID=UPI00242CC8F9|nr:hypothetical protein [Enterobacter ludwigii]WGC22764.1 hypothetical protein NFL61_22950 [Enterobacter ludwigii]